MQSPTIASVDALLHLRRRLLCSASGPRPWPALRQEWLSWMTRERRKRWRSAHRSQAGRGVEMLSQVTGW